MKKSKKLLFIFTLVALLTGCSMRMNIGLKIDKDKKLSVQAIQAMDNEMIDAMIKFDNSNNSSEDEEGNQDELTITDEMRWEFLKSSIEDQENEEGIKIEKYEQDNYKGYIISKEVNNIDELLAENSEKRANVNDEDFTSQKLFVKNGDVYKSNIVIKKSEQYSGVKEYESMGAMFDLKFIITLPNKPISNNADNVSSDGLTLSWNLLNIEGEEKNVDFEFKFESSAAPTSTSNLMIYLGIGGLVLIIAIVTILLLTKKGKKVETTQAPIEEVKSDDGKTENTNTLNEDAIKNDETENTSTLNEDTIKNDETEKQKFCSNCGTKVSTIYCPNCGNKID